MGGSPRAPYHSRSSNPNKSRIIFSPSPKLTPSHPRFTNQLVLHSYAKNLASTRAALIARHFSANSSVIITILQERRRSRLLSFPLVLSSLLLTTLFIYWLIVVFVAFTEIMSDKRPTKDPALRMPVQPTIGTSQTVLQTPINARLANSTFRTPLSSPNPISKIPSPAPNITSGNDSARTTSLLPNADSIDVTARDMSNESMDSNYLGMILGVVAALVIALCIVILVFCYIRRTGRRAQKRRAVYDDDQRQHHSSTMNKRKTRKSKRTEKTPQIMVMDIEQQLNNKSSSSFIP